MRRLQLCNLRLGLTFNDVFRPFTIEQYTFHHKRENSPSSMVVFSSSIAQRQARRHHENAYVEFTGSQKSSILFTDYGTVGRVGTPQKSRERKFIEDILLLGSVLT